MSCGDRLRELFQLDDVGFVTELYREFLEREPEAEGLEGHLHLLRSGLTRYQIVAGIAGSQEALQKMNGSELPVLAMSTLGANGRFGNQLFQYAFLRVYAKRHGLRVETSPWIGRYLFGCADPPISRAWPMVTQSWQAPQDDHIPHLVPPLSNVDIWGYFQYHTSYYAPDRQFIRSLFVPTPAVRDRLQPAVRQLRSLGKTVVGIHLRRTDCYVFTTPSGWYKQVLADLWPRLEAPVLFLASDDLDAVRSDFTPFHPVTSWDLNVSMPEADFYPDFYLLSQCDYMAISNSSYSFTASWLNDRAQLFLKPDPRAGKLVPYDPWNCEPLWHPFTF